MEGSAVYASTALSPGQLPGAPLPEAHLAGGQFLVLPLNKRLQRCVALLQGTQLLLPLLSFLLQALHSAGMLLPLLGCPLLPRRTLLLLLLQDGLQLLAQGSVLRGKGSPGLLQLHSQPGVQLLRRSSGLLRLAQLRGVLRPRSAQLLCRLGPLVLQGVAQRIHHALQLCHRRALFVLQVLRLPRQRRAVLLRCRQAGRRRAQVALVLRQRGLLPLRSRVGTAASRPGHSG